MSSTSKSKGSLENSILSNGSTGLRPVGKALGSAWKSEDQPELTSAWLGQAIGCCPASPMSYEGLDIRIALRHTAIPHSGKWKEKKVDLPGAMAAILQPVNYRVGQETQRLETPKAQFGSHSQSPTQWQGNGPSIGLRAVATPNPAYVSQHGPATPS